MLWLALKTLFHEKGRLLITLLGITFSTILSIIEIGIYLGMMANATAIIRHTDADIWVASKNIQNFDFANPFPEVRINQVRSLPEVLWAEKILLTFGFLKLPNGGREQIQIIGYNPDTGVGGPWDMVHGSPADVKGGRYMVIDKTSEQRLGRLAIGTNWELSSAYEYNFKLVGLSNGIKSFTTMPLIFMAYNQAENFFTLPDSDKMTFFIVAKLKDKEKTGYVLDTLRGAMKDNDVFSKSDLVAKTVKYWTIQTGMGMAFFLTAILAVIIGGAIVGQTIYANTVDHLMEFGTLKAVGARNSDIYKVIFSQAGISAVMGYVIGSVIILFLKGGIEDAGVPLVLSPVLFATMFFVILFICLASAYFSVRKVRVLDPVMVFRV